MLQSLVDSKYFMISEALLTLSLRSLPHQAICMVDGSLLPAVVTNVTGTITQERIWRQLYVKPLVLLNYNITCANNASITRDLSNFRNKQSNRHGNTYWDTSSQSAFCHANLRYMHTHMHAHTFQFITLHQSIAGKHRIHIHIHACITRIHTPYYMTLLHSCIANIHHRITLRDIMSPCSILHHITYIHEFHTCVRAYVCARLHINAYIRYIDA